MPLSRGDVLVVVNNYIGVNAGYLGDFSYRTHDEFYPMYCDLDIDPQQVAPFGTTRERFIEILSTQAPINQAKILRGVIQRFPGDAEHDWRRDARPRLEDMITRLETADAVRIQAPSATRASVVRALDDAEVLLRANGAVSVVDRVHTALHGHLHALCEAQGIELPGDPSMQQLLRALRERHPAVQAGPRAQDVTSVLLSMGAALSAFNPIRNRASVAHPNVELLDEPEAMLVVNAARTILNYLDSRLGQAADS